MMETNAKNSVQTQQQPASQAGAPQNPTNNQPPAQSGNGAERQMGNFAGHKVNQNAHIGEILTALMGFSYSEISIKSVSGVMQKYLGDNWRSSVYDCLSSVDEEQYNAAVKKLDELFTYENALAAWGEAVGYSQNPQSMYSVNMTERLEALEYWLKFFGEEGVNLYSKVRGTYEALDNNKGEGTNKSKYIEQAEGVLQNVQNQGKGASNAQGIAEPVEEFGNILKGLSDVNRDVLWQFNYFLELCSYYDRTMSRVAAQCVHKNIKMEQYEHIKYAFDVLEEMVNIGQEIMKNPDSSKICERVIDGGIPAFEKMIKHYSEELYNVSGEGEELEADILSVEDRDMFVQSLGFVDRASKDGVADASADEKKAIKKMEKDDEAVKEENKNSEAADQVGQLKAEPEPEVKVAQKAAVQTESPATTEVDEK